MKIKYTLALILIFILNTGINAQQISPFLWGQNHWMATGDESVRVGYLDELWPEVKESGITCVRIGGNGYNKRFPSRKRLNAMVDSIRNIGAEPLLQVPDKFTALQAKELVEYFSQPKGKKVTYYSIGNEPLLHDDFTVDEIHEYLTRIATAMKEVDPSIKIFVFDECELREQAYRDLCGGRLDMSGVKVNGAWLIDGFNFHRYPNGREFSRDDVVFKGPQNILNQTRLLIEIMEEANQKYNRTGSDKLMWGLSEVNVTYANPDREISGYGNASFLAGQFMAEVYGIGMKYGAFSINPWCISETDRVSTDFGYLGLPTEFYPRSSYYHTQMMAQNMKGKFLETSSNQKYVKTIGSVSDEQICILVMNQDKNRDFDFDIILNEKEKSKKALQIGANLELNAVIEGTIENQTSVMFILNNNGQIIKKLVYGLKQNLKYQSPVIAEIK
jgi:hypothetical protein